MMALDAQNVEFPSRCGVSCIWLHSGAEALKKAFLMSR